MAAVPPLLLAIIVGVPIILLVWFGYEFLRFEDGTLSGEQT